MNGHPSHLYLKVGSFHVSGLKDVWQKTIVKSAKIHTYTQNERRQARVKK